eukprot:TRINITY_DN36514_c0_g1_i1.p1 TRINITY_DN36514_c0_g1~~TRINITY_DN36514_c0_g1_i1.p1  ORF type:complete len:776 (+),score=165.94 TRINITY_DN36514_c0_g1_i1:78-2330(+)
MESSELPVAGPIAFGRRGSGNQKAPEAVRAGLIGAVETCHNDIRRELAKGLAKLQTQIDDAFPACGAAVEGMNNGGEAPSAFLRSGSGLPPAAHLKSGGSYQDLQEIVKAELRREMLADRDGAAATFKSRPRVSIMSPVRSSSRFESNDEPKYPVRNSMSAIRNSLRYSQGILPDGAGGDFQMEPTVTEVYAPTATDVLADMPNLRPRTSTFLGNLNSQESLKKRATRMHGQALALTITTTEIDCDEESDSSQRRTCRESIRHCCRKVVFHPKFDTVSAVAIFLNAIYLGVQVELMTNPDAEEPLSMTFAGYFFYTVFNVELILRLSAYGCEGFFRGDNSNWNLMDLFIVVASSANLIADIIMSTEQDQQSLSGLTLLRAIRIFRLLRVMKIIRVMRFFHALRVLLSAIFSTLKSCVWALMLLSLVMYIFSVAFTYGTAMYMDLEYVEGTPLPQARQHFGSIPRSIYTLFMSICGGISWVEPSSTLSEIGDIYVFMFIVYISFTYFAVLNVINGLFCQQAIESAMSESEEMLRKKVEGMQMYEEKLLHLFKELDRVDGDSPIGMFSLDDLDSALKDGRIREAFLTLEITPQDSWTLFKLLDSHQQGLVNVEQFVAGCMKLNGPAKSIDMNVLLYESRWMMDKLSTFMEYCVHHFQLLEDMSKDVQTVKQDTSIVNHLYRRGQSFDEIPSTNSKGVGKEKSLKPDADHKTNGSRNLESVYSLRQANTFDGFGTPPSQRSDNEDEDEEVRSL